MLLCVHLWTVVGNQCTTSHSSDYKQAQRLQQPAAMLKSTQLLRDLAAVWGGTNLPEQFHGLAT